MEVRDFKGELLPGATLQIFTFRRPHDPVKVAVAQEQGIASVLLKPGRYRVQVTYPATETYTTDIEIEGKGTNCRVIVSLARGVG